MKYFVTLALVILFCCSGTFGQKIVKQSDELPWRVEPAVSNTGPGGNQIFAFSFKKGILYLTETQAITTIRYPKGDWGLASIDDRGKVMWETAIKGLILGVSYLNNQVMVIYAPDRVEQDDSYPANQVYASILEPKSGKVLSDKLIFKNKENTFIDIKVLAIPNGQDCSVLVRTTRYRETPFSIKRRDKLMAETKTLQLLTIKSDLATTLKNFENAETLNTTFIASEQLQDGSLVILSKSKDKIIAERFAPGDVMSKGSLSVETGFDDFLYAQTCQQKMSAGNSRVALSLMTSEKKVDAHFLYSFDWETKKVISGSTVLDKDYISLLTSQHGALSRFLQKKIGDLLPIVLLPHENSLILIKQGFDYYVQHGTNHTFVTPQYHDIVVSIYDSELKPISNFVVEVDFFTRTNTGQRLGANIIDNKLHVLANTGITGYLAAYSVIDLVAGKVLHTTPINKDGRTNNHIEPDATIWFRKTAILPYYSTDNNVTKKKWKGFLQTISY